MPEAVIVAYGRSPIGRANKGSLVEVRPDDLAAHITTRVLQKVPQLDRATIDDLMCGCGLPAGEQGFNLGRVVSILTRLDVPGTTVNRYCASSLQTSRMAFHAIKAGEGDAFLSVGVECVSRYVNGFADQPDAQNPRLKRGNTEEYPDIYIAMGETAENVADLKQITREEMDRYAVKSQTRAVQSRDGGFFDREIIPVPLPNGTTMNRDDGPRPNTTMEVLATLKPVFRENGRVTAGNSCPLNDGAAAVVITSDRRARDLGIRPLARIIATPDRGVAPGAQAGGYVDRRRRHRGDQRSVRRTGHPLRAGAGHRPLQRQAESARRLDRARASLRHDRGPHPLHAAERSGHRRQDDRHGDDVRGRGTGYGDDRGAAQLS